MNRWTPLWIGFAMATVLSFAALVVAGWFWYRSTPLQAGTVYMKMGCIDGELEVSFERGYDGPVANNDNAITWCDQEKYYVHVTNGIKSTRYLVTADIWQDAQIGDHYSAGCECVTPVEETERPPALCFVGKDPCE